MEESINGVYGVVETVGGGEVDAGSLQTDKEVKVINDRRKHK